ncbi:MAG: ABC transporter permease [Gammaproteobacteria bacterium]
MHPIVSALRHHKTTVILLALEIAVSCAIITNALFTIGYRFGMMNLNTGVADNELVWVMSRYLNDGITPTEQISLASADLAALRAMPNVKSAIMVNSLPLTSHSWTTSIASKPGDENSTVNDVALYAGTSDMLKTLGIRLIQGRDFLSQEYTDYKIFGDNPPPAAVIITHSLAERLWPGENPLGKPIYLGENGKHVTRVVGVVDHLLNPHVRNYSDANLNLLLPVKAMPGGMYVLRVSPKTRNTLLKEIPKVLDAVDDQRIITDEHSYAQTRADYFHDDRALIWLLLVVIACLLALTALSLGGLSSFWVQQRTHHIGIRRAVGATRKDILLYFLIENFLIVGVGVILGLAGAVGLNLWLVRQYELPHLRLAWLPIGALVLWLIGQLAVLGPALRAAAVHPSTATRNV